MTWLGDLSVRDRPVGGDVADSVTATPADWLLGRRHVVLFVHGFNSALAPARSSYAGIFTTVLSEVGYFFWPGDTRGGSFISALSYPFQIQSARDSATRLADYLRSAFGPEGTPSAVSFVAHSLGCRLILEALRNVLNEDLSWPEVRLVALMAAAVPTTLVEPGQSLEPAARRPQTLALFYSFADDVLRFAFPTGQDAAYRFGIEEYSYGRAVGRYGQPAGLTPNRFEVQLGHGEYWPSQDVADQVAQLLGAAGPRPLLARELPTHPGPQSRILPPAPGLPARRPMG